MINKVKMFAAATAVAALPMVASAAHVNFDESLSANNAYSFSYTVENPNEPGVTFTFTAMNAFTIEEFSLTGSGTNGGADIASTTYTITNPNLTSAFNEQFVGRSAGFGGSIELGTTYAAGDVFSVTFDTNGNGKTISYGLSFDTIAAAVPVPAAGLLLLGALGGIGAMRRRKKA